MKRKAKKSIELKDEEYLWGFGAINNTFFDKYSFEAKQKKEVNKDLINFQKKGKTVARFTNGGVCIYEVTMLLNWSLLKKEGFVTVIHNVFINI